MKTTDGQAEGEPWPPTLGRPPGRGGSPHCWPLSNPAAVCNTEATATLPLPEKQLLLIQRSLVPLARPELSAPRLVPPV